HHLLKEGVKVELIMCGDGPYFESSRKRIEELRIEKSITMAGHRTDIEELLSSSHALLLTSAWAGLPRIGLEAIAVGRPVFAFDVKGTRSLPGVVTAPDRKLEMLASLIEQKIQSGFAEVTYTDPIHLHPNS